MRVLPWCPLVGLLGSPWAMAQEPGCEPVDASVIAAHVDAAYTALYDDDAEGFGVQVQAVQAATPCLVEPVPAASWARLLYGMALVRYAEDRPWRPLVDAALRADPELARRFGPPDVKTYEPGPPDLTLPEAASSGWWVDGVPVQGGVSLAGPHIVQRQVDGGWRSAWLDDAEALPEAWVPAPAAAPEPAPDPEPAPEVGVSRAPLPVTLRLHSGTGLQVGLGQVVEGALATEPRTKLVVPLELGLHVDLGPGWLRLAGSFTPIVMGSWVYEGADGEVATRFGGGLELAGGGRIRVGHVGALVGGRDPSRLLFQAVGGAEVHRVGVRLEGRAGVAYTTAGTVEPAFAVMLVVAPKLWASR